MLRSTREGQSQGLCKGKRKPRLTMSLTAHRLTWASDTLLNALRVRSEHPRLLLPLSPNPLTTGHIEGCPEPMPLCPLCNQTISSPGSNPFFNCCLLMGGKQWGAFNPRIQKISSTLSSTLSRELSVNPSLPQIKVVLI